MWGYVWIYFLIITRRKGSLQKTCGAVGRVGRKKQYLYICKYISYQLCKLIYIFLYIQKMCKFVPQSHTAQQTK